MKKFLVTLLIVFFAACSAPATTAPVEAAPAPPAKEKVEAAEQEDVVIKKQQMERVKAEAQMLQEWWQTERQLLTIFLTGQLGMPADIIVEEVAFMHDFQLAVMRATVKLPVGSLTLYVIITRPDGEWGVAGLIIKEQADAQQRKLRKEYKENTSEDNSVEL